VKPPPFRSPADVPAPNARTLRALCLVDVALLILAAWLLAALDGTTLGEGELMTAAVVATVAVAWWLSSLAVFEGELFQPWPLMMMSAIVFHFGLLPTLVLLPSSWWPTALNRFSDDLLARALATATLGLAAFHLGGLLGSSIASRGVRRANARAFPVVIASLVGWVLLGVGVAAVAAGGLEGVQTVASMGYAANIGETTLSRPEDWLRALEDLVLVGGFLVLAAERRGGWRLGAVVLLLTGFTALRLLEGDRSGSVLPLIGMMWILRRQGRVAIGRTQGIAWALAFLAVSPVISSVRQLPYGSAADAAAVQLEGTGLAELVRAGAEEYGKSVSALAYTLDLVPDRRPFEMGMGYVEAVLYAIPNRLKGGSSFSGYGNPAEWLVWEVAPRQAAIGGGLGFSFVAEAYLQGGVLAVCAALSVFGLLLGWASQRMRSGSEPRWLLLGAVILAFGLRIPRGITAELSRPLIWYWALPLLVIYVLGRIGTRQDAGLRRPGVPGGHHAGVRTAQRGHVS
jgi:hypothetical protein